MKLELFCTENTDGTYNVGIYVNGSYRRTIANAKDTYYTRLPLTTPEVIAIESGNAMYYYNY